MIWALHYRVLRSKLEMIRDVRKSKEYFDDYIKKEIETFNEFAEMLDDEDISESKLPLLKQMLFNDKLDVIIAKYSRGDDIEEIILDYNQLLEIWKDICGQEFVEVEYEGSLWVISMAVLLNVEEDVLTEIKIKLKEKHINDWIINFLLEKDASKWSQIEDELLIPEKYQTLKKAICSSDKDLLFHYLEKEWYQNCKAYGWYDSHKLTRKSQQIYSGYWCFEAGAIVKLLKWDDSDFKEQQYYPYDLVHYKE